METAFKRAVRKGEKGIKILAPAPYKKEIEKNEHDNSRFDEAIIETLENSFGELKSKSSITDAVISAAQNAACDSKADYLSELKYAKENSFLDSLDELNIDVEFQQTAETSIAYTVLQRLGINADEVFEREDFPHIMNFNTIPALSVLGIST